MLLEKILYTAKAWCALAGAIGTALLTQFGPDSEVGGVLTIIVVVATAIVVFVVPNADATPPDDLGAIDVGTAVVICFLGAILLLLILIVANHPGVLR